MNALELAEKLESYRRINAEMGRVVVGQTDAMADAAAMLRAQNEALEPFANAAPRLDFIRGNPDEFFIWSESGGDGPKSISVAQIRRAARVYGRQLDGA